MARLISSSRTRYYKRVFPKLFFGFLAFFFGMSLLIALTDPDPRVIFFIVIPLLLGPFGYFIIRRFVSDLVDEVYDEGDALVVKNDGREERIPFTNIVNVADSLSVNPPRITLTLHSPSSFGREVAFSPPKQGLFRAGLRNPIALGLIERVEAARHAATKA
jgi:hypothetical protein